MSVCICSMVLNGAMSDNIKIDYLTEEFRGNRAVETTEKNRSAADLNGLIWQARSGNLEAFEKLYNLFKNRVYGLAFNLTRNHQVSEDLTQEIFLKIFSSMGDMDRPEFFPAWVYRIALNTCYTWLKREKTGDEKLEKMVPRGEERIDDLFDSRADDLTRAVQEALSRLPEKLRTVFLLHEVEGLTHEEIAETLGCQVGTSKSQLFKARMKLRKMLEKQKLWKGAGR